MNSKDRQCYMCRNFDRYYTKGVKRFNKTEFGLCCQKRENVNIHCNCGLWAIKPKTKKINGLSRMYLNDLLTEISAIRMVVEEESCGNGESEEV